MVMSRDGQGNIQMSLEHLEVHKIKKQALKNKRIGYVKGHRRHLKDLPMDNSGTV